MDSDPPRCPPPLFKSSAVDATIWARLATASCADSPAWLGETLRGDGWSGPGAPLFERRLPSQSLAPAAEANSAPRIMIVRIEDGAVKVLPSPCSTWARCAIRPRADGSPRRSPQSAPAVEDERSRSERRGVAVDVGVLRSGSALFLVLGAPVPLLPWWRSVLWRFPYAEAERDKQRITGKRSATYSNAMACKANRPSPSSAMVHCVLASPTSYASRGRAVPPPLPTTRRRNPPKGLPPLPSVADEFDIHPFGGDPPPRFGVVRTFHPNARCGPRGRSVRNHPICTTSLLRPGQTSPRSVCNGRPAEVWDAGVVLRRRA